MARVRLVPSNNVVDLFPKNPVTGETAVEMDRNSFGIPLLVGQKFDFQGHILQITALGSGQTKNGEEVTFVWVDLDS